MIGAGTNDMSYQEWDNWISRDKQLNTRMRIVIGNHAYLEGEDFCVEEGKICPMSFKMQAIIKPRP